jgi:hypothetical protein
MVLLCLASICLLLCPALRVFVHLTWLVARLSCLPCRIWCKIIISSSRPGPLSPVPGWVGMARVVLPRVCPSLHPLQNLLCAAFCAPEAVVSGLLPVARDQRMLVPVGALLCMLLAIACLGHLQQRPGSDLPQLRAGVLHWLTSPGLPAVKVLEVTSHLVWTHQTTDDPRQLLGPRSPLSVRYTLLTRSRRTARRQAHRRFVVQAL